MSDSINPRYLFHRISMSKSAFHKCAEYGNLALIIHIANWKSKEEMKLLVSTLTKGSTPLLMACRNGHSSVATYLLQECSADIEQTGQIKIDSQTVKGVPPLWCAAAAGHLNLVKCLLEHKATVNSVTSSHSTPLRAACFDGNFDVVKYLIEHGADIEIANRHGHTCLMIACYKGHNKVSKYLVECGADVNRKTDKGNTALHDCAESGNLDLLKLLLQNGATFLPDSSGKTPLISAAFTGREAIVEYFLQGDLCSKQEKIEALELLGATFIDEKEDMPLAFRYWRQAMELRYEDKECLIEKPEMHTSIASYVNSTEVRTLSQLEDILSDPHEMRMQALLVRERILGAGMPDSLSYIRRRGKTYADESNIEKCMELWLYALDVQRELDVQRSLILAFTVFIVHIMETFDQGHGLILGYMFSVLFRALKDIETFVEQDKNFNNSTTFHKFIVITMNLVSLMCRLQPHMSNSEGFKLKRAVYRLVRLNPRVMKGLTPLHLACLNDSSSASYYRTVIFPSPEVVDLLLEVGVSPNAVDEFKNTPLHIAATNRPFVPAVFHCLLNKSAHLDVCNAERLTPLELAPSTFSSNIRPLRYVNLQCLSAKAVQFNKIAYKGLVHKRLELFIDSH